MVYGLIHTAVILIVMVLFFPQLDLTTRTRRPPLTFMLLGSFSFVGIGMMAAILPLLYVERGAQMTFVLQSCCCSSAASTTRSTSCPTGCRSSRTCRRRPTSSRASAPASIDGVPVTELWHDIWPLIVMGVVFIPFGLWAFGRAERYAKRTGKLKRVG